jgi:hypothetical protein
MALLSLPPALSGFAVIVSVLIAKIGINAFCDVLAEDLQVRSD